MRPFRQNPRRGSALLASMIVVVVLSFAAAGVLSYSLTTYRNSVRQTLLDQAKEVADSEMENLFYTWKSALLLRQAVANAQYEPPLSTLCASTNTHPFAAALTSSDPSKPVWAITRAIAFAPIANTPAGGASGIVPGTLNIGTNYYYTAKTSASTSSALFGTITYHSGRNFVYSSTSLFQFAVFYQGNLEIAAGGAMTINGPISTNASAYIGSQSGFTLTLASTVYYFQDYNGAPDPLSGETNRLVGSGALDDPIYNPDPHAGAPANNNTAQRALQVVKNSSQASFIGGVDVATDLATYPAAYQNLQGQLDPNEVYRAVIAPPPLDNQGHLIAEDPVVQDSRMFNTAGILITIEQTAAGSPAANTVVHVGYGSTTDPNVPDQNKTAYDGYFSSAELQAIIPPAATRLPMNDPREVNSGGAASAVNLTTVDIGALGTKLQTLATTLGTSYNGVVYVYDKTNNASIGATGQLNGILLTNGATTPAVNDQNGNPLGFSVVSNNGVYIQGDYNTTPITVGGQQVTNPAAVLGDAITAVSQGWTVTKANTQLIAGRISNADGTSNTMTINAAILTGNTPSSGSGSTAINSGGVQNLVRMIEDWFAPGDTLTLNGSLGQLFTSKYFTGNYVGNGPQANIHDKVYVQPTIRNFNYDINLRDRQPAGTPTTTNFARGDFFFW